MKSPESESEVHEEVGSNEARELRGEEEVESGGREGWTSWRSIPELGFGRPRVPADAPIRVAVAHNQPEPLSCRAHVVAISLSLFPDLR